MKQYMRYKVLGVMLLVLAVTGSRYVSQDNMQRKLADKVLRFHVLANSDSAEDQKLKLEVRDAIGSYMQTQMPEYESKEACEAYVKEKIPEIEQVARQIVTDAGFTYAVHAELEQCEFPVKTYGVYTFPAGSYDALKVTIGEGRGENWWCVMYPNMCFENSMYEVADEKSGEALRAVLDEEEYRAVLNAGNYEVRFRLFELILAQLPERS